MAPSWAHCDLGESASIGAMLVAGKLARAVRWIRRFLVEVGLVHEVFRSFRFIRRADERASERTLSQTASWLTQDFKHGTSSRSTFVTDHVHGIR